MKNIKTLIWKITKWTGLVSLIAILILFIWIKGIYKEKFNESEFENLISEVVSQPELPNDFYITLEKVYPRIFKKNLNGHLFYEGILGYENNPCPCRWWANRLHVGLNGKSRLKSNLFIPSLTWAFESDLTQKQCFNAVMANFDFYNQTRGIEAAANKFYGKELAKLEFEEQLELIVIMKNPSLYSKYKKPESLAKKVKELKMKIQN